jgi:hypothetical protein
MKRHHVERDHAAARTTDRGGPAPTPRYRAVLEAMAYAGAVIDPTGVLVAERLRRIREGAASGR